MTSKTELINKIRKLERHTEVDHQERWMTLIRMTASSGGWFESGVEGIIYTSLGLVGEAGEIAGEVKKIIRNDNGSVTIERRSRIVSEIGDVFWYLYAMMNELGIREGDVWKTTVDKLTDRLDSNTIKHESTRE